MRGTGCLLAALLTVALLSPAAAVPADEEARREWVRSLRDDPHKGLRIAEEAVRRTPAGSEPAERLRALEYLNLARDHVFPALRPVVAEMEEAVGLARRLGDGLSLCYWLERQARQRQRAGNPQEGDRLLQEARALAEKPGMERCLAHHYITDVAFLGQVGRKAEAMTHGLKAYELFERDQDKLHMAQTLWTVGVLHGGPEAKAEDQAKAADYLQRALDLIEPRRPRDMAARMMVDLALTHYRRQDLDRALALIKQSVAMLQEVQSNFAMGIALFHLGSMVKDQQKYEEALAYFDESLRKFGNQPDDYHSTGLALGRADALARLGRRAESLDVLARLKSEFPRRNFPRLDVYFYTRAAQLYDRMGEFEEAYRAMRSLQGAEKALAETANVALAEELKVRFQVQLKDAENALLRARQKEAEAQQREAEARRWVLVLAFALTVIALGSLVLFLRRRAAAARTEARHHQAHAEAAASASRAKSTFLANMSHELRSPLNALLGFSRLLLAEPSLSARARHDVAIILRSGEHLYGLINHVLEISKIEAGRIALEPVPFNLHALLDDLEESFALGAGKKGLQLVFLAENTVPRLVRTDAVKLRQVLTNLLSNAIKFTETGSVTLRVDVRQDAERTLLRFSVADTGVGIDSEEIRQLGAAFVQAQAGRQAAEGTGLGLAISRNFVQLMGGELQMTSEPGRGTTMQFEVPVEVLTAEQMAGAHEAPRCRATGIAEGERGLRILAVDDRADGRQLLVRLLEPLGFEVREAANGLEAVEACEQWSPHLVCMDMRMPVMNGLEATRRIKAQPGGKGIVIVALTASSFEEEREGILASGCDDFLRKPFREEALLEIVARHLQLRFEYEVPPPEHERGDDKLEAAMAELPGALRDALAEALSQLDVEAIDRAIDAVAAHDARLGRGLAALAARFDHRGLRALVEAPAREKSN
ncbi:response regulator [Aquincola sp. S2]|uniref:histidine kinase n=1 Tax=Pseudaquabacterium terrae TaxID=2732868 RepID=A0ABX2EUR2_9BURK|nr:ATP-binding protein [Aquabacterium terrae]NRF72205.1 response regulator [Aquabacterium terrae]